MKAAVTLPVHSYGLKEVERYVGFERSQEEFGGDWSIAVWEEAVDAGTADDRQMLLKSLATYNEEDLEGMWAVYKWLGRLQED